MPTATLLLPLATLGLLLCSCVVETPQSRIFRDPAAYESLTPRQQELVQRGGISKDMPRQGVLLALGHPNRKAEGFRDGADFERWDYTTLQPVYSQSLGGYYGYGRRGYNAYGFGISPSIEYIPIRSASVWFNGGLVNSWERLSP